ncbi:RagB/SusD family nutrient uptake outer membrane protein [Chitinophaga sp. Hz27]|uniref:RagB/SusD family nutrient uptake outer membrane protein n=1 Tax=Chitinophaga sp. Hz27 TaxID=3347169 RepID=UPI0035E31970
MNYIFKYKILSPLLIITVFSVSCNKYLEKKPDASLVVPSNLTDLQGILDDAGVMNTTVTPSYGETSSDDYFLPSSTFKALTAGNQKYYTWQQFDYTFGNDWSKCYLPIYNANVCLEAIQKIPKTGFNVSQWENIKGAALFYRAYYFLWLSWTYAKAYDEKSAASDLGIVLRLGTDFNVASFRESVLKTYDRIIEDAKEAVTLLPDNSNHPFRPSKTAAYGLLARTYLSMGRYNEAGAYADSVLQLKATLMDYNDDADINGNVGVGLPFKRFNKEILFYTEMNTSFSVHVPARGRVDTTLYSSFAEDDLRRIAFFKIAGGYPQFKGSYASSVNILFSGIAIDEMYLIRSECNARLNRINEAMNDLNTLLKMRWKNTAVYPIHTASNMDEAINRIMTERRKELLMRGLRWIDVKRLNMEGRSIIMKRNIEGEEVQLLPNSEFYALPLPVDIISISGILQN